MKRRRETEAESSEIRYAIDELSVAAVNFKTGVVVAAAAAADGTDNQITPRVPVKPFLSICSLLVRVLDKIGPTMAVLRQDIHHNIQRLEKFHDSNPRLYWDLVEILKKEANEGKAKKGPTCSKAFVWLTRSLDLVLCLLQLLVKDLEVNMEQAIEEAYNLTLKPWHGWISSTAYKIALKLVPDTRNFIDILKAGDGDEDDDMLKQQLQKLIYLLFPVLEQNKSIMRRYGLDKLKST